MLRLRHSSWLLLALTLLASGCIVPDDFTAVSSTTHAAGASPAGRGGTNATNAGSSAGATAHSGANSTAGRSTAGVANASGAAAGRSTAGTSGSIANTSGQTSRGGSDGGASNDTAGRAGARVAGEAGRMSAGGNPAGGASMGGAMGGANTAGGMIAAGSGARAAGGSGVGSAAGSVATGGSATGGNGSSAGSAGTPTLPAGILTDCNLLLHLDETSWNGTPGEVRDSSGNGNHGTATTGASTTASVAKWNRAGRFDGNGFVDMGDNLSLRPTNAFTVAAWFNLAQLDGYSRGIVAKRWGWRVEDTFALFVWGGDTQSPNDMLVYVDVDSDDSRFTSDPGRPLRANVWYHVAVVYDGTLPEAERVRLYVNGTLDVPAHFEATASIPITDAYDGPLQVGNLRDGGVPFLGSIDEVVMWRRPLAPEEVTALYWAAGPLSR